PARRAPARAGGAPGEVVGRGGAAHEAAFRRSRVLAVVGGERLSEGLTPALRYWPCRGDSSTHGVIPSHSQSSTAPRSSDVNVSRWSESRNTPIGEPVLPVWE